MLLVTGARVWAQDPPETDPVFRSGVAEVRLDVQVLEGAKLISDLSREDFVVRDEGAPQRLSYFGREREPLSLLLLLDISGSMRRYIELMSRTSREALNLLRPGDRVGIMVYGRRPRLHFDFSESFDEVAQRLRSAPENPYVGAGTSTNDAVVAAARMLAEKTTPAGRRAVLIVTDNGGLNERLPDAEVVRELLKANAVLNAFAVGKAERPRGVTVNTNYTPTDVFALAEQSGGEALKSDRPDSNFASMMERIRARYALAYPVPAEVRTGQFRRVIVELSAAAKRRYPKAAIRARSGYYVNP